MPNHTDHQEHQHPDDEHPKGLARHYKTAQAHRYSQMGGLLGYIPTAPIQNIGMDYFNIGNEYTRLKEDMAKTEELVEMYREIVTRLRAGKRDGAGPTICRLDTLEEALDDFDDYYVKNYSSMGDYKANLYWHTSYPEWYRDELNHRLSRLNALVNVVLFEMVVLSSSVARALTLDSPRARQQRLKRLRRGGCQRRPFLEGLD